MHGPPGTGKTMFAKVTVLLGAVYFYCLTFLYVFNVSFDICLRIYIVVEKGVVQL